MDGGAWQAPVHGVAGSRAGLSDFTFTFHFPLILSLVISFFLFALGFDPWVGKIPWRRERLPPPVFWAGEFHGLYSPCGHKEWNTTE